MRHTKLWPLLLSFAGVSLVVGGIVWALVEGYVSDVEGRSGNIVPAALVGAAGFTCLVIGVAMSIIGSRRPSKSE